MTSQRGFNLIEMTIAVACSLLLAMGAATLAILSVKSQMAALGKQSGTQQNSEIKDLLFNLANTSSRTCIQRLGLTGHEVFNPSQQEFDLPTAPFQNPNSGVNIDRLYLTGAAPIGAVGSNSLYTAQLKINQSIVRSPASLAPAVLGTMNFAVDSSGHIVSCNWDTSSVSSASVCDDASGTVSNSISCYMTPSFPQLAGCPTGFALQTVGQEQKCLPANTDCTVNNVGNTLTDGSKIDCNVIPANYAIRYPANYAPPTAPTNQQARSTINQQPPPISCSCGSQSIPAGGTQKCVRGWHRNEFFGASDDYFEVQICNAAGALVEDDPMAHVFNEEGNGVDFSWRIGSCTYDGGYKNVSGTTYVTGNCY